MDTHAQSDVNSFHFLHFWSHQEQKKNIFQTTERVTDRAPYSSKF